MRRSVMAGLLLLAATAQAQMGNPGAGGAMAGCPGMGAHAMMGGGGPGMMGGGMMGPGMMGGMMGPGMMGGGMMGPGMMGPGMMGGGLAGLNLSEQQQRAVSKIQDDQRRKQWDLMGKMMDQQAKLRDLYAQERWDAEAIAKVYDQIGDLRKQMVRSNIQARNQIYEQLTAEQRASFRQMGPWWAD